MVVDVLVGLSMQPKIGTGICWAGGKDKLTRSQAKSLAKRAHWNGRLDAYLCRHCGRWHVGNRREW